MLQSTRPTIKKNNIAYPVVLTSETNGGANPVFAIGIDRTNNYLVYKGQADESSWAAVNSIGAVNYVDGVDLKSIANTFNNKVNLLPADEAKRWFAYVQRGEAGQPAGVRLAEDPDAGTIPLRTTDGNVRTGTPVSEKDAVSFQYYATGMATKLDAVRTVSNDCRIYAVEKDGSQLMLNGVKDRVSVNTVVIRNKEGRIKAADPTEADDVATKKYVDDKSLAQENLVVLTSLGVQSTTSNPILGLKKEAEEGFDAYIELTESNFFAGDGKIKINASSGVEFSGAIITDSGKGKVSGRTIEYTLAANMLGYSGGSLVNESKTSYKWVSGFKNTASGVDGWSVSKDNGSSKLFHVDVDGNVTAAGTINGTGGTLTGNVTIEGNLVVNGTTTTTSQEQLAVENAVIIANAKGTSLVQNAGLAIRTDATKTFGFMYVPSTGLLTIGKGTLNASNEFSFDANEGQAVATVDQTIPSGNFVKWDATKKQLVNGGSGNENSSAEYVYVKDIGVDDWTQSGSDWVYTITAATHNKGAYPAVEIFDANSVRCYDSYQINFSTGDVTFNVPKKVAIKVVMRPGSLEPAKYTETREANSAGLTSNITADESVVKTEENSFGGLTYNIG